MSLRRAGWSVLVLTLFACAGKGPSVAGSTSSGGSSSSGGRSSSGAAGSSSGGGLSSSGGGSASSGGGSSGGAGPVARACEEPAPWALPAARRIVGTGTAATCTADALRTALQAGGAITFSCGDGPVVISIPTAIQVAKESVVDGEGKITLDGGATSQIFVVTSKLSVRNLRFVNAKATGEVSGGAVSGGWRSSVEVIGCTFEDNTAAQYGGAVAVGTGSTLVVVGSRFARNQSRYGGAIYSLWSPLHVVNSEFVDNSTVANATGGAIGTDGALDPAYRNPQGGKDTVGGTIEICGSNFRDNKAQGAGGAAFIWAYPPDRITIDRCTVERNVLTKDSNGLAMGGGMRVSNGEITIKGTSFLSNSAATHGGALSLDCAPLCTITNSTFHANQVTDGFGGAIFGDRLRVNNATFAKNHASSQGGALFGGADWVFKNTVFVDNGAGNPWGQAAGCASTGKGDHVLQWDSAAGGAGSGPCISGATAADPRLAEPADNGGATWTMLPAATSPVLGAGADCEASDQRGRAREPGACDLGAVEVQ